MADHAFLCYTRATGEPRQRHRGETNRWFNAKLITEDQKLETMFLYAHALSGHSNKIRDIMEQFSNRKMIRLEQWAALGTQFRMNNFGWGSGNRPNALNYAPNEITPGIRKFVTSKSWTITELNNFIDCINLNDQYDNLDAIFAEIAETPEYLSDFIMIENGEATNYLTQSAVFVRALLTIIEKYNLEIKRLLIYIHYLNIRSIFRNDISSRNNYRISSKI